MKKQKHSKLVYFRRAEMYNFDDTGRKSNVTHPSYWLTWGEKEPAAICVDLEPYKELVLDVRGLLGEMNKHGQIKLVKGTYTWIAKEK